MHHRVERVNQLPKYRCTSTIGRLSTSTTPVSWCRDDGGNSFTRHLWRRPLIAVSRFVCAAHMETTNNQPTPSVIPGPCAMIRSAAAAPYSQGEDTSRTVCPVTSACIGPLTPKQLMSRARQVPSPRTRCPISLVETPKLTDNQLRSCGRTRRRSSLAASGNNPT